MAIRMSDEVKPNGTQFEGKETYVKDVFTEISGYYDEMNENMSLHMIQRWHRYMMKLAGNIAGKRCLDVGTGTGEIAFLVAEHAGMHGHVTGLDITPACWSMPRINGAAHASRSGGVCVGDALKLPYLEKFLRPDHFRLYASATSQPAAGP